VAKYREVAGRRLMADENVRLAVRRQNLKARGAVAAKGGAGAGRKAGTLGQIGEAFAGDLSN
jgi:hypothetical protein